MRVLLTTCALRVVSLMDTCITTFFFFALFTASQKKFLKSLVCCGRENNTSFSLYPFTKQNCQHTSAQEEIHKFLFFYFVRDFDLSFKRQETQLSPITWFTSLTHFNNTYFFLWLSPLFYNTFFYRAGVYNIAIL